MTRAHEHLYIRTLRGLVAAGVDFCVLGTFGLRWQCPALRRRFVADCDIMLPADLACLTTLVQYLQAAGWHITLWQQPVRLPLRAATLVGKYYLRAHQAGAVLDCAYENDYLSWDEFAARRCGHNGLPVVAAEHILAQKAQCQRPADQLLLRRYQAATSGGAAASGASQ